VKKEANDRAGLMNDRRSTDSTRTQISGFKEYGLYGGYAVESWRQVCIL
jgi:hypothetical protein